MERHKLTVVLLEWHFTNLKSQAEHYECESFVEYAMKLLERAIEDEENNIWFEREMKREAEFDGSIQEGGMDDGIPF